MEKDAAGCSSLLSHTSPRTPAQDGTSPAAYPTRRSDLPHEACLCRFHTGSPFPTKWTNGTRRP